MGTFFLSLLILILLIQIFLTHLGLSHLIRKLTKGKIQFSARIGIFFIPTFRFYGKDIHLLVNLGPKMDSTNLKIQRVSFFISPIELFKRNILIKKLDLFKLEGHYISRIPSKEKTKWLPPDGKVVIQNANLLHSDLIIKDKTRFPVYHIHLKKIDLHDVNMDMGYPGHILFHTKKGYCEIGSGCVQTELYLPDHGFIKISGVTWGEFMNIESIPIQPLRSSVELHAEFKHKGDITNFRGVLGRRAKDRGREPAADSERFGFNFDLDWKENKLTIDLVLRKLIYQIFSGTLVDGVVSSTVSIIRDSIFAFLQSGKKLQKVLTNSQTDPILTAIPIEPEETTSEEVSPAPQKNEPEEV